MTHTPPLHSEATAPARVASSPRQDFSVPVSAVVTVRAFVLGLFAAVILAGLNAWLETRVNSHFLGGVQLPCGAIFSLLLLVIVNKSLQSVTRLAQVMRPFSPAELLTIYVMTLFAALVSTAGTDNFFLTTAPALFYFSTRENRWADLFYQYVPGHFAPGWNGRTYRREVIEPFYTGGVSITEIPWHAWAVMLTSWGILLLLVYTALFFLALLLRRQWIENEAISFPLIQLPLQMVEVAEERDRAGAAGFWTNRTMWAGAALAAVFHMFRGLNFYFPDWPAVSSFQGNAYLIRFTEAPWNAVGIIDVQFFFGAIGIAYLLTRELSFSFWFFFLALKIQFIVAALAGFPPSSLPRDTYLGRPVFISYQSAGAWLMMGVILLWTARGQLYQLGAAALRPSRSSASTGSEGDTHEPFSPRFILLGLLLASAGVLAWCWYSGINPFFALAFFMLYVLISMVLARLVVEGGLLFPQVTFGPLEILTGSVMSSSVVGAASLTKISFLQPMLFADMRSNLLPGFLHTLKISHDLRFTRRETRKILLAAASAVVASLLVATTVTLTCIYSAGGLTGYTWFTQSGPQDIFRGTANMLNTQPGIEWTNWFWMVSGATIIYLLALARARFLWFPLHPLAFLIAPGFPITQLWPSFFVGWLTKTLLLKYGGHDAVVRMRPFMIGLILGNALSMVLWMIFGFLKGTPISYWPA